MFTIENEENFTKLVEHSISEVRMIMTEDRHNKKKFIYLITNPSTGREQFMVDLTSPLFTSYSLFNFETIEEAVKEYTDEEVIMVYSDTRSFELVFKSLLTPYPTPINEKG